MDSMPKEGAARPLYSSAPDYTQNYLTAKPKERWTPPRGFVLTAVCSYLPAYLYTRYILFGATKDRWTMLLFAVVYLIGVELLSRSQKRPDSAESGFWMVCWLVQSAALMIFPDHAGSIYLLQWLAWHATAVYWTMCRTGMLCAGQSGLWTPVDLLMGVTVLPWRDFLLRARTLAHGGSNVLRRVGGDRRRALGGVFSAVMALAVCVFAWEQLAGVDETFARLGQGLFGWLDGLLSPDTVLIFVLSLPVGAWLFGLIGGGLRHREAPLTAQALDTGLASLPRLPVSTGYLVPGALCGVYGLFFAVQAYEFFTAAGQGLTAQAASDFAVTGFWELCRILLLDFVVFVALRLFGARPLRQPGSQRRLMLVFGGFGFLFAALAAAKLGTYILLYGPTPQRVLSGWFLAVLLVWCVLAVLWLMRPVPAARIAVLVLAGSFSMLCCADIEGFCVRENIDRYQAGVIDTVDTDLLVQCGVPYNDRISAFAARALDEAGWFDGRTGEEIARMYGDAYWITDGTFSIVLDDGQLELTFSHGVCTGTEIVREG